MTKKSWLISFIGLLGVLSIALVVVIGGLNPATPEVAALPTLALLPSITPSQAVQAVIQPTPLPIPQEKVALVAKSAENVPNAPAAIAPAPLVEEKQADTLVQPASTAVPNVLVATAAPPVSVPLPSAPVPDQIVIHFDPSASAQARAAYIQQIGGTVSQNINSLNTVVVNVPKSVSAAPLPQSDVISSSEPDYFVVALDDSSINDPLYAQQWALPVVGASNAWASLPANTPSVPVAVIDSGICANHPDLAGRILPGYDFVDGDNTPQDDYGHGCGVAGIIAANPNNSLGIAGVAPNALIMPLKVLNAQGIGTYSDVAAALVYAADNGAKIVNLSLGGAAPSTILESAVNYAIGHGVIIVAAAGNTGGSMLYPAAYPAIVAVASVDPDLQRSSFSSYGPEVDLLAPGRNILTTTSDGNYGTMSGTSFSAPQVAGVAALEIAMGRSLTLGGGIVAFGGGTPIVQSPTQQVTPTIPAVVQQPATGNQLFSDVDSAAADQLGLATANNAHSKRARFVNINTSLVGNVSDFSAKTQVNSSSDSIVLNLFDDVTLTAVRTSYTPMASGSIFWHGTVQGVSYGEVDLVMKNGIVSGNVFLANDTYEIRYSGRGNVHLIREVDAGSYPEEKDDQTVQVPTSNEDFVQPSADNGSRIDVLVVYTDDARAAAGGTTAMQDVIDQAEQDTNQSYINSGILQRVNVVASAEVNYAETNNSNADLTCIQSKTDGCLDNIHTLRDQYHADVVVFIGVNIGTGLCGQAYNILGVGGPSTVTHSFEQYAFLVVSLDCSVSNHSFAHELGHLMAARHDYYVDPTTNGPYTYNHGYVYLPAQWRTIMAYNNACADSGFNCTRLRYWSNPDVLFAGVPMGRAEGTANAADNRKTLNNTALVVSNFRDSSLPDDFSTPTTISTVNYTTTISTIGSTVAADDPNFACIAGQRYNTVWFRFTPNQSGTLTVNTFGSNYDTVLGIWTGTRGSLTSVGCGDDFAGNGTGRQSQVSLHAIGGTTYYFEVASYDGIAGTLKLTSTFAVPPVPTAPVLVSPAPAGALINDTTPDFRWNAVPAGVQYHIQVDNLANFSSPEVDTTVNVLTVTSPATLTDGTYYWRVQALNANNIAGAWSLVGHFTLDTVPPGIPVLIAPVNNPPASTNNKPIFSWQPVTGAVRYQLLLDTANPPTAPVQNSALTTYTPPAGLLVTTYYWCVKAVDPAGNLSPCSEVRSLSFVSPTTGFPNRNRYSVSTPTLSWNRVTWANGYEIQIDNDPAFASLDYDLIIPLGTTLSQTITKALPNGVWYWRMRARRTNGTWGPWSPADSFAIVVP